MLRNFFYFKIPYAPSFLQELNEMAIQMAIINSTSFFILESDVNKNLCVSLSARQFPVYEI